MQSLQRWINGKASARLVVVALALTCVVLLVKREPSKVAIQFQSLPEKDKALILQKLGYSKERHVSAPETKKTKTVTNISETKKASAPCGEICSYKTGTVSKAKFYPFIRKEVNCKNIITRLVKPPGKVVIPPLADPPKELYEEFTQNGEAPIKYKIYANQAESSPASSKKKNDKVIERFRSLDRAGKNVGRYKDCPNMKKAMLQYTEAIKGKRGLVVGTLSPWLEAILLNIGADWITTSEYAELDFVHPRVNTTNPYKLGELMLNGKIEKFDFAASFSSIEHSGLGRYGDPLNPYGDFEAMAQVWCMLKPDAYFFLGLPVDSNDESHIVWNAHRFYGTARLKHLTANFKVINKITPPKAHGILILKKVSSD